MLNIERKGIICIFDENEKYIDRPQFSEKIIKCKIKEDIIINNKIYSFVMQSPCYNFDGEPENKLEIASQNGCSNLFLALREIENIENEEYFINYIKNNFQNIFAHFQDEEISQLIGLYKEVIKDFQNAYEKELN